MLNALLGGFRALAGHGDKGFHEKWASSALKLLHVVCNADARITADGVWYGERLAVVANTDFTWVRQTGY